jgi:hypothetical protein
MKSMSVKGGKSTAYKPLHGADPVTQLTSKKIVVEAEFAFDAHPFYCNCCPFLSPPKCCQRDYIKKRTYFRIYENRLEYNQPYSLCCCIPELFLPHHCIRDNIVTEYFDMGLSRSRARCCCHICSLGSCCGGPRIYNFKPRCGYLCLAMDCSSCYGEALRYHSHSCRLCDCFGFSCVESRHCCSLSPFLLKGLSNSGELLEKWRDALEIYKLQHPETPEYQWTTFNVTNFDGERDTDLKAVSTVI